MNRDDAQALIETGAAKGQALALARIRDGLNTAIEAGKVAAFAAELEVMAKNAEKVAAEYSKSAEALLKDLEHPGARLARRVLFAARAARDAWRAAR